MMSKEWIHIKKLFWNVSKLCGVAGKIWWYLVNIEVKVEYFFSTYPWNTPETPNQHSMGIWGCLGYVWGVYWGSLWFKVLLDRRNTAGAEVWRCFQKQLKNLQLDGWKTTFSFWCFLLFSWDMLALAFSDVCSSDPWGDSIEFFNGTWN